MRASCESLEILTALDWVSVAVTLMRGTWPLKSSTAAGGGDLIFFLEGKKKWG